MFLTLLTAACTTLPLEVSQTVHRSLAAETAQTPPAGLAWFVLNEINSFYLNREDPTDRPSLVTEVPTGVLVPVNVNNDGISDWLINWPESSQFCGTGGCERTLYVSKIFAPGEASDVDGHERGVGFVLAFDRQAGNLDIREINGEVRVESSFHHLNCDDTRRDCRLAWGWDPKIERLVERPSSDGSHIIVSAGQRPVDIEIDEETAEWVPSLLLERRLAGGKGCPDAQGAQPTTHVDLLINDIPDLNGDGIRDWIVGPPPICDGGPSEYGFQVWVSTERGPGPHGEGGAVSMAYQALPNNWVHLDVAREPAQLIVAPACQYGNACTGVPLHWNASLARLVE